MTTDLFIRGINFPSPAPEAARALAGQVALAFAVRHRWVCAGRRLEILGPQEAVQSFFATAHVALTFGGFDAAEA